MTGEEEVVRPPSGMVSEDPRAEGPPEVLGNQTPSAPPEAHEAAESREPARGVGPPRKRLVLEGVARRKITRRLGVVGGPPVLPGPPEKKATALAARAGFLRKRSGRSEMAAADAVRVPGVVSNPGRRKGKPGRRDVREKDLPQGSEEMLDKAKLKEWVAWKHYEAVEALSPERQGHARAYLTWRRSYKQEAIGNYFLETTRILAFLQCRR